jgi:hypothetical protein
MNFNYAISQA